MPFVVNRDILFFLCDGFALQLKYFSFKSLCTALCSLSYTPSSPSFQNQVHWHTEITLALLFLAKTFNYETCSFASKSNYQL